MGQGTLPLFSKLNDTIICDRGSNSHDYYPPINPDFDNY